MIGRRLHGVITRVSCQRSVKVLHRTNSRHAFVCTRYINVALPLQYLEKSFFCRLFKESKVFFFQLASITVTLSLLGSTGVTSNLKDIVRQLNII